MREHIKADEPFERSEVTAGEAIERFLQRGPGLQGRADRGPGPRPGRRDGQPLHATASSSTSAAARTRPTTGPRQGVQADLASPAPTGAATRTARCSRASTAPRSTTKEELAEHLERLEQAEPRDHRRLGRELDLFMFSELSPGSPFWLPERDGDLERARPTCGAPRTRARGYREVHTPILYDAELWKQSGHWDKYRDNMYFTDVEGRPIGLKPMNCPAHCSSTRPQRRSYRDLPIRYSEPGLVHRHEPSGTLHGLLRVRQFTQDDAHIFCTEDQIEEEVIALPRLRLRDLRHVRLRAAARALDAAREADRHRRDVGPRRGGAARRAGRTSGLEYELNEGDGAFYGPKIDFHMTDSIGRSWQLGTVQLDYSMPERFELDIHRRRQRRAPAGDDPPRAVGLVRALHRHPDRALRGRVPALAGAGAGDRAADRRPPHRRTRARSVERSRAAGLRVEVDERTESIGRKIREAELRKIPYMLVVGDREAEQRDGGVRRHREGDQGALSLDDVRRAPRRARWTVDPRASVPIG